MPTALHLRAAAAAAGLALAVSLPAVAQDGGGMVYKCASGGRTVYQDHPCGGSRDGAAPEAGLDALFARSRAVEDELLSMQQAYQAQMQALEIKRRRAEDPAPVEAEIAAVERSWQQRLGATRARHEAARASIRARCPRGASVADGRTTCLR